MSGFSIHREGRLKHRKDIDFLFSEGRNLAKYPVLLFYTTRSKNISKNIESLPYQVGFTVSKKKFKRAVDRNKIKRLMREAFRLNQAQIDNTPETLQLMFVYTAKEILPLEIIEKAIVKLLKKVD